MKWTVCDDSTSSSSDDDVQPIIPTSNSEGNLSTIEESHLENGVETDSNSSSTHYSSFDGESISSLSSDIRRNEDFAGENLEISRSSSEIVQHSNRISPSVSNRNSDGSIQIVRSIQETTRIIPSSNSESQNMLSQVLVSSINS